MNIQFENYSQNDVEVDLELMNDRNRRRMKSDGNIPDFVYLMTFPCVHLSNEDISLLVHLHQHHLFDIVIEIHYELDRNVVMTLD